MEHPQARPFGIPGRRKPTRDFLSLYSHSSAQQDPPRPPSQGSYLKTQDFLQPLESKEGKASYDTKEEAAEEVSSVVQKPPPSVEHLLPGGIGTYSISHISYFNNQRISKQPEASVFAVAQASSTDMNDENSNCSSYAGSGFTLWEESAVNKGKTGKENTVVEKPISGDSPAKLGQWALAERTSQSYSSTRHNSFNSLPSSQSTGLMNKSFIEMIKSAKDDFAQDEELDNEEPFTLKKECPDTQLGELRVKVDGKKSPDQKPNTPRSKHSATEQRRRSKINDRFQMLRELIPQSDQKRDKASFLLEVIEYIHFLQEKVHKYDGSYQGWNQEAEKLMPWRNNHRPAESYVDQSCGTNGGSGPSPALMFASKFDEKSTIISPAFPGCTQNVKSGMSPAPTIRTIDQHGGITNKTMPIPLSLQSNFFTSAQSGCPDVVSQPTHRLASDAENNIYQPLEVTAANDKQKEKEITVEGGAISISSAYSKGLLNSLTQALQSSGVDLSRTSISVQIELGKQANIRQSVPTSGAKGDELVSRNQRMARSRVVNTEDSDQPSKKLKTRKS